ncbi:MAG: FecR domain-containing protein [Cyclobacteriaceae bacterium]|nr:FecR domain-containing protein [Cyclobacteriaceae bacterium]
MQYKDFTHLDFIQDQYFLDWVQNPSMENERFWQDWLMHNPDKEKEIQLAKALIGSITYSKHYELDERALVEMNENIVRFNNNHPQENTSKGRSRSMITRYTTAAGFLLIVSLASWLNWPAAMQPIAEPVEMVTKFTPAGAKMKLVLPDGTRVILNSQSSITYPEQFVNQERVVHFYGEAFFDVQPDPEKPFIILTENLETRVLGTSFNVSAYPGDKVNKVAVSHGMVKVIGQTGEQVLLSQNEMVILNLEKETIRRGLFNMIEETGWKDGTLYFRDVPLGEVFLTLEKWFDVEIHCTEDVRLTDIYSGQYSNESLDNILKGISYTSGLVFTIGEKNVNITSGKEVSTK